MSEYKKYDLEERCFNFAKVVGFFCNSISKNFITIEYMRQLIRSLSSIGANYIEANESLGEKDFLFRIKISRKEAKESNYWLRLIKCHMVKPELTDVDKLLSESIELKKIFSSIIINKSKSNK